MGFKDECTTSTLPFISPTSVQDATLETDGSCLQFMVNLKIGVRGKMQTKYGSWANPAALSLVFQFILLAEGACVVVRLRVWLV